MATDAWQIGSITPPTVCLCCGSRFDDNIHKMRGPYDTGPYRYVCDWCWKKPYMYFPDKDNLHDATTAGIGPGDFLAEAPIVQLEVTNGRKLNARLVSVPVRLLRLNPNNPRVKHKAPDMVENEIEDWLWKTEGIRSLYNEIRYSGGLSEKPIIDSTFIVVEGNRRITCLRRLDDQSKNAELPQFAEDAFERVQCLMLPPDADPKDVDLLIARAHVSGKKEWSPLNQAEQVFEMVSRHGLSPKQVGEALSLSSFTVDTMLHAFEATVNYGKRYPDIERRWIHKFSYFYELFRSRRLSEWSKDKKNLRVFMKLLSGKNPKLYLGSQVRDLPEIVRDRRALDFLTTEGYDAAIAVVKERQAKMDQFTKKLIDVEFVLQHISKNPSKIQSNPESMKVLNSI